MADPPFILLLVAADEADRRLIGELLRDGHAEVHWVTSATSALAAVGEHPHDAVLLDAALGDEATVRGLLEEDPRAQVILLGDPSGADAVRARARAGAVDHLPKAALDADTLERAVRYAADHRRSVERLQHDALHDALTGLPNRTLFLDRLEQSLRRARRRGPARGAAVLFLDLDRFKVVNDSLGHHAGDELLQAVAQRLDAALRPGDTVARMGGDEFTVLLEDVDRPARGDRRRRARARHARRAVPGRGAASCSCPARSGSRSAARRRPGGADPRRRRRDVPRQGRGQGAPRRVRRADAPPRARPARPGDRPAPGDRGREPAGALPADLPHGRPRDRGFEALCRWEVEPREFVAIAEETGLIVPLGALRAARGRAARGRVGRLRVGQRLRPPARRPGFARASRRRCAASGAAPEHLRLEVTESAMSAGPRGGAARSPTLRAPLGVTAHLDDFGTGASSLRFLHRFPGDALKIDRGLVIDMLTDPGSHEIVKAIVGLAHNLGMEVVGEGVETAAHLERLQRSGCELAQGFHLSAAAPAAGGGGRPAGARPRRGAAARPGGDRR